MQATPSEAQAQPAEAGAKQQAQPASRGRAIKRTFQGFDLRSVAKFGAAFYVSLATAWVLACLLLFLVARMAGVAQNIESFVRASGFEGFRMTWFGVVKVLLGTGSVAAILLTVVTLLAAYLFNLVADVFGGIEMTVVQDDLEPSDAPPSPEQSKAQRHGV